jgi:hypothetical protein
MWTGLIWLRMEGYCEHGNEPSGSIKFGGGGVFLSNSDLLLFKKGSVPWSWYGDWRHCVSDVMVVCLVSLTAPLTPVSLRPRSTTFCHTQLAALASVSDSSTALLSQSTQ